VSSKRELVRRVRVFADLADEECDAVAAVFKPMRAAAGTTIFNQGDPGSGMLVVVSGNLTVRVKTPAGNEETVRKMGPGDVLGELSFFDAKPRSATVIAKDGAELFAFTREAMRTLRRGQPRVAAAIYRGILKDIAFRLRDLAEKSTEGMVPWRNATDESSVKAATGTPLTAAQLAKVPMLAKYGPDDLEMFSKLCSYRKFAANEGLMEQGKRGGACWLMVTGEVVATTNTQATPLATLGPGALVGQLALIDGTVRSATVTAKVPSSAIEIRGPGFQQLMKEHSPLALRFQEQVLLAGVTQVRTATDRFAALAGERAEASMASKRTMDWDSSGVEDIELELDLSDKPMNAR